VSSELIGWMGMGAMVLLLLLRVPVAFVLAGIGFLGYAAVSGIEPALMVAGMVPYSTVAAYTWTVLPLFILMGHFASQAGFIGDLFQAGRLWLGRIPGGVVHATIAAGAAFGAASGSGIAATTVLARICVPEMRKAGVEKKLACGCVASVGPIAQMIPPSILMVMYGMITETSIGKLLIAGIFPGLLMALSFMVSVYVRVKLNPSLVLQTKEKISWKERFSSLRGIWGVGSLAFLIMGGIYTGLFTPTEAGGVGAFGAFVLALGLRKLSLHNIYESLTGTARTTGMIFLIVAGASMFGYFLNITGIPSRLADFITALPVSSMVILIGVMILYLFLGCFIEMSACMFITLPILFPAMVKLGIDPIWFGVLIIMQSELAPITPPFGITLFVVKSVVEDIDLTDIIRGVMPFILVDLIVLAMLLAFPQISLFLPQMMSGK